MFIGSIQKLSTLSESVEVSIDDISVKQVSTTKSLRIIIDENLMWHIQIDKITQILSLASVSQNKLDHFFHQLHLHLQYLGTTPFQLLQCSLENCCKTLSENETYKNFRTKVHALLLPPVTVLMLAAHDNDYIGKI